MTAPRFTRRDISAITTAFARVHAALEPLVAALRAAFRALGEALRYYAIGMQPMLAEHLTSPRTQRRREAAHRTPAQRRVFRRERRGNRRWLRRIGRKPT